MTKRKHYADKPLASWHANDFLAYLTDENKRRFGVTYSPFGRGSKSQRFGFERGTLKQAVEKYGAAVVKRFIDECFDEYASTPDFPCMTWGFVYSYRDRGLVRAQAAIEREAQAERRRQQAVDDASREELRDIW